MNVRAVFLILCALLQCGGIVMRGTGGTPVSGFCAGFATTNLYCNSFERASGTSACTSPNQDAGSGATVTTEPASPTDASCDCKETGADCLAAGTQPSQGLAPNIIPAGSEVLHFAQSSSTSHTVTFDDAWPDGINETIYMRFCFQSESPCSQVASSGNCKVQRLRSNGAEWNDAPEFAVGMGGGANFRVHLSCQTSNSSISGDLALDVWHAFTLGVDENTGSAELWINQDSSGAPDLTCTGTTVTGPWDGFTQRLRSDRADNNGASFWWDHIEVSNDEATLDDEIFTRCPGA